MVILPRALTTYKQPTTKIILLINGVYKNGIFQYNL
jgi:hypothetical protein